MNRLAIVSICIFLLESGVVVIGPAAGSERFAPDNPWFQDFEKACRDGTAMKLDCEGSVNGAFAEHAKVSIDKVSCDFAAFWRTKDADHGDRTFAVLPWQYGVEFIVAEPGVCKTKIGSNSSN